MAVRTITVTVSVYTDEEEQADYILFTDRDIAEREKGDEKLLEDAKNFEGLKTSDGKKRAKLLRDQVDLSKRIIAYQLAVRDRLLPLAQKKTYTLMKPKWRAYTECEEEARGEVDQYTGEVTTDKTKLMLALMPDALKGGGMSKEDIDDLEVGMMAYLWDKLYRSIWPSEYRLNFLSQQSETR